MQLNTILLEYPTRRPLMMIFLKKSILKKSGFNMLEK